MCLFIIAVPFTRAIHDQQHTQPDEIDAGQVEAKSIGLEENRIWRSGDLAGIIPHYKEQQDGDGLDQVPMAYVIKERDIAIYLHYIRETGFYSFQAAQGYQRDA